MSFRKESGQALIEFSVSAMVLSTLLVAGARLLLGEWQSTKCSYLAFEAAHSRLTGRSPSRELLRVSVQSDSNEVSANAFCGSIQEHVTLPRLEPEP